MPVAQIVGAIESAADKLPDGRPGIPRDNANFVNSSQATAILPCDTVGAVKQRLFQPQFHKCGPTGQDELSYRAGFKVICPISNPLFRF